MDWGLDTGGEVPRGKLAGTQRRPQVRDCRKESRSIRKYVEGANGGKGALDGWCNARGGHGKRYPRQVGLKRGEANGWGKGE